MYIYIDIYICVDCMCIYVYKLFLATCFSKNECKRIYVYIHCRCKLYTRFNTHLQVWVKSHKLKLQEVFQQKT